MADILYAVATYNPVAAKSTDDLRAIQRHNNREEPLPHVVSGAPPPHHIIGTGDLVRDVETELARAALSIEGRRKNGVLAYELVLTATHEFFAVGNFAERHNRLMLWLEKQIDFLLAKFGRRVVSIVLHRDEYTPHLHVVLLPLVQRDPDAVDSEWALVGRSLSGPGRWEALQTEYSEAMAELGLARGEVGSERKHRPYAEVMAEMEKAKAAAQEAEEKARAAIEASEKEKTEYLARAQRTEADRVRLLKLDAELVKREAGLLLRQKQPAARENAIQKEQSRLEADRDELAEARKEFRIDRNSLDMCRRGLDNREAELAESTRRIERDLEDFAAIFTGLDVCIDIAGDLFEAVKGIRTSDLPDEVVTAIRRGSRLAEVLYDVKIAPSVSSNVGAVAYHLKKTKALIR